MQNADPGLTRRADAHAVAAVSADKQASDPATVLVVDDDPAVVELVTSVLQRAGFAVVAATDAEVALDAAREREIDLALLDVLMPGMDGIELCARLRDERGDELVPVVFLSALQDAESK